MHDIFYTFAALLLVAAVVGAIGIRLRQPLIVSFIVTGILVGPAVLGWVRAEGSVVLLAEIGVTVLLFAVGLKLDMQHVRHLGPVALATGIGQLVFTIVLGYLIGLGLGLDHVKAIYVAVALTFSSTIIIVKLLSDKREIDSLHGRIAMGFLIVQDLAVVIAMMLLGALGGTGAEAAGDAAAGESGATRALIVAGGLLVRLAGALLLVALMMRYVLPRLMTTVARSQELVLIFAIAWGVGLAALGEFAGFGKEVGALLAGFSLASSEYRESINARLTGVRDFLLLFFFVELGARLDFSTLGSELGAATVFALFVLIGNPLIVMVIMGVMGYRRRTGFLAGLTVAQISEFSIVFIAMGIAVGHVTTDALGLITMVGLVTIAMSTYMILYSAQLFAVLDPWLRIFERRVPYREVAAEASVTAQTRPSVIVYGLGRYGSRLLQKLDAAGHRVLGIDFDPDVVAGMRSRGIAAGYGDAEDPDFPESLPLADVRWVVSTVPQTHVSVTLLQALRRHGYRGRIAVTAHHQADCAMMSRNGADLVLLPFQDAADFAADAIGGHLREAEELAPA